MSTSGNGTVLNGRRAEARRNDQLILDAARIVFLEDPAAPISEVARRAQVGIAALYRRYRNKEVMLGALALEGQLRHIGEAERALKDVDDPWRAYVAFLHAIVDANTPALAIKLAGRFTPTAEHLSNAVRLAEVTQQLFDRAKATGEMRPDVVLLDVGFFLEILSGFSLGDAERSREIRHRFLSLFLDGLHVGEMSPLSVTPPTWEEQEHRWVQR